MRRIRRVVFTSAAAFSCPLSREVAGHRHPTTDPRAFSPRGLRVCIPERKLPALGRSQLAFLTSLSPVEKDKKKKRERKKKATTNVWATGANISFFFLTFFFFFFLGYIWCVHRSRDIPKLRASAGYETKCRRAMAERWEHQSLGSSVQIIATDCGEYCIKQRRSSDVAHSDHVKHHSMLWGNSVVG